MGSLLPERHLRLLLAAAFLAAGGSNPYGLHPCPHHEGPGRAGPEVGAVDPGGLEVAAGTVAVGSAGTARAQTGGHGAEAGTHGPRPDGPCTCVGTCHPTADPPVPGAYGSHSPALGPHRAASPVSAEHRDPKGPRHLLFELHLPNAPPASV